MVDISQTQLTVVYVSFAFYVTRYFKIYFAMLSTQQNSGILDIPRGSVDPTMASDLGQESLVTFFF